MNAHQRKGLRHELRKFLQEEYGITAKEASNHPTKNGLSEDKGCKTITQESEEGQESHSEKRKPPQTSIRLDPKKWLRRALRLFSPTALGFVASLLAFYPKFTSEVAAPLTPTDPMSATFQITYDGPIPIRDVRFSCVLGNVITVEHFAFQDIGTEDTAARIPSMSWGDANTVQCKSPMTGLHAMYADISLVVEYSPIGFPLFRRGRIFRFLSVRQSDGGFRFVKKVPLRSWGPPYPAKFVFTHKPQSTTP